MMRAGIERYELELSSDRGTKIPVFLEDNRKYEKGSSTSPFVAALSRSQTCREGNVVPLGGETALLRLWVPRRLVGVDVCVAGEGQE